MTRSAKRGVAFNFNYVSDLPLLSPYITWDYNWGNSTNESAALWFDANEIDYCPMCWSGSYDANKIRTFVAAHPNTKYLLAFNEPNLTDQANMTPAQAAALWPPVVALAKELNLKLVSPAMNYGTLSGYSDPIKWLDEFFAQPDVSIDDVDAIAVHSYMASPSAVQSYIERFRKYNKPVWVTEFCAWDPKPTSAEVQMDYMCAVLHYMENECDNQILTGIEKAASRLSCSRRQLLRIICLPALKTALPPMRRIRKTHGIFIETGDQFFQSVICSSGRKRFRKIQECGVAFFIGFFQYLRSGILAEKQKLSFLPDSEYGIETDHIEMVADHIQTETVNRHDPCMMHKNGLTEEISVGRMLLQFFLKTCTNTFTHLSCGSFCKSHDQNPVNIRRADRIGDVRQDPFHEHSCFSGARRRTDQQITVFRVDHSLLVCCPMISHIASSFGNSLICRLVHPGI